MYVCMKMYIECRSCDRGQNANVVAVTSRFHFRSLSEARVVLETLDFMVVFTQMLPFSDGTNAFDTFAQEPPDWYMIRDFPSDIPMPAQPPAIVNQDIWMEASKICYHTVLVHAAATNNSEVRSCIREAPSCASWLYEPYTPQSCTSNHTPTTRTPITVSQHSTRCWSRSHGTRKSCLFALPNLPSPLPTPHHCVTPRHPNVPNSTRPPTAPAAPPTAGATPPTMLQMSLSPRCQPPLPPLPWPSLLRHRSALPTPHRPHWTAHRPCCQLLPCTVCRHQQ